jgi:hypothetical protein
MKSTLREMGIVPLMGINLLSRCEADGTFIVIFASPFVVQLR